MLAWVEDKIALLAGIPAGHGEVRPLTHGPMPARASSFVEAVANLSAAWLGHLHALREISQGDASCTLTRHPAALSPCTSSPGTVVHPRLTPCFSVCSRSTCCGMTLASTMTATTMCSTLSRTGHRPASG